MSSFYPDVHLVLHGQLVAFSPDNRRVAANSHKSVTIRDVSSGETITRLEGHESYVLAVASSPSGRLVSGEHGGTIKVWNWTDLSLVKTLYSPGNTLSQLALSHDGRQLLVGTHRRVCLVNLPSGRIVQTLRNDRSRSVPFMGMEATTVALHPFGAFAASTYGDHHVYLWRRPDPNAEKGLLTWVKEQLTGHRFQRFGVLPPRTGARVYSIAFSPSASPMLAVAEDNAIQLWDVSALKHEATLPAHDDTCSSLAWIDASTLVSCGYDGRLKVWNIHKDQPVYRDDLYVTWTKSFKDSGEKMPHQKRLLGVTVSWDKKLIAVRADMARVLVVPIQPSWTA